MALIGIIVFIASFVYYCKQKLEMMDYYSSTHPGDPVTYDHQGNAYWKGTGEKVTVLRDGNDNKVISLKDGRTIARISPEDWSTYHK